MIRLVQVPGAMPHTDRSRAVEMCNTRVAQMESAAKNSSAFSANALICTSLLSIKLRLQRQQIPAQGIRRGRSRQDDDAGMEGKGAC